MKAREARQAVRWGATMWTMSERIKALANEQSWWTIGHILNEASEVLSNWIGLGKFAEGFQIGRGAAALTNPSNGLYVYRRKLVVDMLYAFAVENWLKGLLVASYDRMSSSRRKAIDKMLEDMTDLGGRFDEQYMDLLFKALNSSQVTAEMELYNQERSLEDLDRFQALKPHMSHFLERLANAAGLRIDQEMQAYLNALSDIAQVGRYPAHSKKEVGNLEPFLANEKLKRQLGELIFERYHAVGSTV